MTETTTPAPVRQHAAAALATVACALSLAPVISGGAWLLDVVLVVVVVAVAGALAGAGGARPVTVVLAQALALVATLTVVHTPAEAVWAVLPGPAVWEQVAARVAEAGQVVQSQAAPIDATLGVRLVVAAGAGALALLVDVLAVGLRRPAVAGLALLAVHVVGVVFAPGGLGLGYFLLAVAGFVLLLVATGDGPGGWGVVVAARGAVAGTGRPVLAAASAMSVAAAVLAAVAVPAVTDLRSRPQLFTGSGGGIGGGSTTYLNPMLDLRSSLSTSSDTVVMRYSTDQRRPQPLRIVTVDTFTGDVWEPGPVDGATELDPGAPLPPAPGVTPETPTTAHTATITIEGLSQQWLPLPYPVSTIAVDGDWVVDPDSLNVIATGDGRTGEGQRYEVAYAQVEPDPAQLAAAPPAPQDVVDRYARLPEGLPSLIAETAAEVAAEAGTPYEQAVALQEWFRSDGGFSYSLAAPEPLSGSALADFLTGREGYCVHYASAMAVMARTLGIPARVAVGFLPGSRTADGGWEVSVGDAHAWPELYFEGAGWLRFEPTPGSRTGLAPAWTVEGEAPTPGADGAPSAGATSAPSTAQNPDLSPSAVDGASTSTQEGAPGWLGPAAAVLAGLAGVAGLLFAPRWARALSSRRRWRRADDEASRAEAAWADLVEQLGDLGVPLARSSTPRQVGRQLEELEDTHEHRARVRRLVTSVERARYGAPRAAAVVDGAGVPSPRPGGTALLERPTRVGVLAGPVDADGGAARSDVRALVAVVTSRRPTAALRRWRWWPASGVAVITGLAVQAVREARRAVRGRRAALGGRRG